MVGDLIIWIKKTWRQQISCRHNYIPDRMGITTGLSYKRRCSKCEKFKD